MEIQCLSLEGSRLFVWLPPNLPISSSNFQLEQNEYAFSFMNLAEIVFIQQLKAIYELGHEYLFMVFEFSWLGVQFVSFLLKSNFLWSCCLLLKNFGTWLSGVG